MAKKRKRLPPKTTKPTRAILFVRDHGTCWLCGSFCPEESGSVDHVIPRSRGGADILANARYSCIPCNMRRRAPIPSPEDIPWQHLTPDQAPAFRASAKRFCSWWSTMGCDPSILAFIQGHTNEVPQPS